MNDVPEWTLEAADKILSDLSKLPGLDILGSIEAEYPDVWEETREAIAQTIAEHDPAQNDIPDPEKDLG